MSVGGLAATRLPAPHSQGNVRSVSILGATGSIGSSTVDLIKRSPDRFRVEAVTANSNAAALAKVARDVGARVAVLADEGGYAALKAALAGTGIADYLFLRGQKLDMRKLHAPQENGAYRFVGGFNPIGLVALAAGFGVYVWIFNPQTLASLSVFKFVTASIPSCVVAGLVHYGLSRRFATGKGWGGYPGN